MRPCPSCGQSIQKSSVFCGTCGAKVPPESLPTTPHVSLKITDGVDPLASTAPPSRSPAADLLRRAAAQGAPISEARVSPRAETGVQQPPPEQASDASSKGPVAAPGGRPPTRGKTVPLSASNNPPPVARAPSANPPVPTSPKQKPAPAIVVAPPAAAPSSPAHPFAPGARVLVQWANGQRYPGVVERVNGPQCLIRFDVGEQRWVESRFVLPAK
jgi:hypothetical protein